MTQRVYLHVGTPKTGTSYLQHVLFHNQDRLAAKGIRYSADRFGRVATDLRSASQGRANYSMQFSAYEQAPKSVSEEVVAKAAG